MLSWCWFFGSSFGAAAQPAVYVIDGADAQILKRDIHKGAAATSATRVLPPREDARGRRLGAELTLARLALTIGAGMLAVAVSGCWMAALQLAPAALSAVGGVGKGAVALASNGKDKEDPEDANDFPRGQKCDDLEMEAPVMVQMETGTGGSAKVRGLMNTQGMEADPRWETMPTQNTAPSRFPPLPNLAISLFHPPP